MVNPFDTWIIKETDILTKKTFGCGYVTAKHGDVAMSRPSCRRELQRYGSKILHKWWLQGLPHTWNMKGHGSEEISSGTLKGDVSLPLTYRPPRDKQQLGTILLFIYTYFNPSSISCCLRPPMTPRRLSNMWILAAQILDVPHR